MSIGAQHLLPCAAHLADISSVSGATEKLTPSGAAVTLWPTGSKLQPFAAASGLQTTP